MNPEEYANLSRIEREHWFYAGKREIARYWLCRLYPLQRESLLVDCGAGTGLFAREMQRFCEVLAIDDRDESLEIARLNVGAEQVRHGSCVALPLERESVNCLTALDVLEHVENDRKAVDEFARVLRPGGVAVITVPALQALWSDWDESLHHYRRYSAKSLLDLLHHPQLAIEHWNFVNVLVLPAVYVARKWRSRSRSQSATRAEDVVPPRWLNSILKAGFTAPACQQAVRFPFGVGLVAAVRRKSHSE